MKILFAKSDPEWTSLQKHLEHVGMAAKAFARYLEMDTDLAYMGAILHDIGKAHPEFQKRLTGKPTSSKVLRHEISSLFFLSAFPEETYPQLIEMVVGHHKSVKDDAGRKGLLDLDDGYDYIDYHLGKWESWSSDGIELLNILGISTPIISREKALENLDTALTYTQQLSSERGYSAWRGVLMGADHFASAVIHDTEKQITRVFKAPDLSFFNRQSELYPLSLNQDYLSPKTHSIVVACTGAGKTDFLFKRCNGRVFYTLPFQASINAMFKRLDKDLRETNPDLDIRVLHAASMVVERSNGEEESVLQSLFGSSIKVLTPHQLAAIAFGMKGFEALLLDLKGCDIILDEIHTYTGISQAIVLKLVQILKDIGCKIHIGTATMPSVLYRKIIEILGEDVLEVSLSNYELGQFDRHRVFKIDSIENADELIHQAIIDKQKVLVILNKVDRAQDVFDVLRERYSDVPALLLHSRFRRCDRNQYEKQLIGLDEYGEPTGEFNTSNEACIVVSTQIVEVSLDISFDIMITETAPLDALIQRFGRINRKRNSGTIGKIKNVYVAAPPENQKDARPYDLEVLKNTFKELPDGDVLHEKDIQRKIDIVFPAINFLNIEQHSKFKSDGRITIDKLTHVSKSILFELLEIDSVSCIRESDKDEYEESNFERRLELEIPVRYFSVCKMIQSKKGNKPFIIPDSAYDLARGLTVKEISDKNLDVKFQIL
ncbi:CRISPR-associated helicase/endonuclease Cas3 [Dyadobacter luteus]|uniref:CRISPR-associated helicase/endonuclease Cas3 n=1 Tax=Dyadobacter luteus TaxID=2259619 RepID=A0A3D8Y9T4_9BACT|nr:CRISPR-associated helicase Cas3' [Dyadobacter luteus]REA58461.1 CRISPR-associated helicase/endonuclease Cas3 [Dyadobacter luteus]